MCVAASPHTLGLALVALGVVGVYVVSVALVAPLARTPGRRAAFFLFAVVVPEGATYYLEEVWWKASIDAKIAVGNVELVVFSVWFLAVTRWAQPEAFDDLAEKLSRPMGGTR